MISPPEITELAMFLRDGTPMDVRIVDNGWVHRVRIVQLNIRRDGESVILRQNWRDGEGRLQHDDHEIDCEDIMSMRPPAVSLENVMRWKSPLDITTGGDARGIAARVVELIALRCQCSVGDFTGRASGGGDGNVDNRHAAVALLMEMTDMAPAAICEAVGYKSPMASQSVGWKLSDKSPTNFRAHVKAMADYIDMCVGHPRSTNPPPWTPILPR